MAQPTMSMYHLSFNQDYTCFSVGLNNGFRIFNTDPFKPTYTELHSIGGIGLVAMLFRCNQFCLVAGGPDPKFSRNKVMIWEVLQNSSRCIGELALRSVVKNVKFRRDKLIIVFLQKVQVYNISDLRLLHQIETALNTNGLCEISNALSSPIVLACLGLQKGQVRVENIGLKTSKFISAHDSNIACISITQDGRFLATASTKGTLIRVFNTLDGSLLQEVRRGSDKAEIYSLAFSSNAQYFAVSSDKGTVHVFGLKVDPPATSSEPYHQSNGLAIFNGFLPKYLSSERSVAQFRLPQGSKHFVGFGHQKNTIVIIGMDGSFYRCEFDPVAGGEMSRLEHLNFLNPEETFT